MIETFTEVESLYFRPITVYKSTLEFNEHYIERSISALCDEKDELDDPWTESAERTEITNIPKSQIRSIKLVDINGPNGDLFSIRVDSGTESVRIVIQEWKQAYALFKKIKNWYYNGT